MVTEYGRLDRHVPDYGQQQWRQKPTQSAVTDQNYSVKQPWVVIIRFPETAPSASHTHVPGFCRILCVSFQHSSNWCMIHEALKTSREHNMTHIISISMMSATPTEQMSSRLLTSNLARLQWLIDGRVFRFLLNKIPNQYLVFLCRQKSEHCTAGHDSLCATVRTT